MSDSHNSKKLDLSNSNRGVWLIKVPKYIENRWKKASGNVEVAKLRIAKIAGSKAEVSLSLSDAIVNDGNDKIPKVHKLEVSSLTEQTLGIFSQTKPKNELVKEKVAFEGKVIQRLECRPNDDKCYMNLKLEEIKKAAIPVRQAIQLENLVQNYKPIADHKTNIEFAARKKAQGKNLKQDKDVVLEMLFKAFEKHQYYTFMDLVKLTKQPAPYLKEILREYCEYKRTPPSRNMWQLKPENRYYKEKAEGDQKDSDFSSDSD